MHWTSILAIYFLFWLFALFLVLPFHGRKAGDVDEDPRVGHEPGAPVRIRPWRIIMQVTLVAAVLFGAYYLIYTYDLIDARGFAERVLGMPPMRQN